MGENTTNNAVQMNVKDGVATIEQGTALTRLHYFDGKFLRADALTLEQDYHRTLVRLSNLAGGWGVVHGLGISLSANLLSVTPGLAITPAGSTVLLQGATTFEVAKLIAAATPAPANPGSPGALASATFHNCQPAAAAGTATAAGTGYYEITVGPVEGLCGHEEVYGKLCEEACVTDSQSPFWKEGLILRLRPISLNLAGGSAVPPAAVHLRNRVASAYFAAEPWLSSSLLSGAGLAGGVWCNPANLYNRDEVPIGLLVQEGATTRFIDAWSARRERMDTQARGYWQGRMMMRPWNVFIAQILQFQCQLPGAFAAGTPPGDDECQDIRDLLASSLLELQMVQLKYAESSKQILQMLGENGIDNSETVANALKTPFNTLEKLTLQMSAAQAGYGALPTKRLLIHSGFLDLPPAGYLPVNTARQPVNEQLKRFFGEGVRLYFCTARPDYIPHAVEQAQHMERISLTRGLDNPKDIEEVEIFVPNGQIIDSLGLNTGKHWTIALDDDLIPHIAASLGLQIGGDKPINGAVDGSVKSRKKNAAGTSADAARPGMLLRQALSTAAADASMTGNPDLNLRGLLRTARLDSGGAALTMACSRTQSTAGTHGNNRPFDLYVDWRITEDPFARQVGDQVALLVEMRASSVPETGQPAEGEIFAGGGKLTIHKMYAVDNQTIAIDVVADLQLTYERLPGGSVTHSSSKPMFTILRQGDPKSGRILLLPAAPATQNVRIGWLGMWQGQPRNAVFGMFASANAGAAAGQAVGIPEPGPENFIVNLEMDELAVALKPENPLRLAALNSLATVATATADQAFLARARRLLFPDAVAVDGELLVRATLDWVMFRRRRHAQCDLRCRPEVPVSTVSAQVWHARVSNYDDVDALAESVDDNDPEQASKFTFLRVDVLHYADGQLTPAETLSQIQADWQAVNPGDAVVLGRAWPSTPAQQGEPHQARLVSLAGMLSAAMPAPAALLTLAAPPSFLADPQFNGGMLLVTYERQTTLHRIYIVNQSNETVIVNALKQDATAIVGRLPELSLFIADLPFGADTQPDADTLTTIVDKYKDLQPVEPHAVTLIATPGGNDAGVDARHAVVLKELGVPVQTPPQRYTVPPNAFGNEIPGATIVFIQDI